MTEFVQVGGDAGLFLPADLVRDSEPSTEQRFARSGPETARLCEYEVLETLNAAREMRARADAVEAHALARFDRLRGGDRYVPDEVMFELRVSRHTAQTRLGRAQALTDRMPRLLGLMEAGEIEGATAARVCDVTAPLEDRDARTLDEQLAQKLTSGRVGMSDPVAVVRAARRLVEKLDPAGQTERARRARTGRKVELVPGEHAMSALIGNLPAEVAAAAYSRIDGLARALRARDTRTLEQLRADVYADLLLGRDPGVAAPEAAATVFIHLPADAALTMSDGGCELSGYGPIPSAIAREIMTNASSAWRRVLTDPASGLPIDLGRHRRRPSRLIRDLVAARDRECAAPGCHRPAQRADFDHLQEWSADGATAVSNGGAKCERDHYRKDAPGWFYTHDPNSGKTTVTTPGGRSYGTIPDTVIEPIPTSTPDTPRAGPLDDTPPVGSEDATERLRPERRLRDRRSRATGRAPILEQARGD